MKIVFATKNPGKLTEMRQLLNGFDVVSAAEAGFLNEVIEDGQTLEDNALKKAQTVSAATGSWSVADDSGLFIQALNGLPGINTGRWAGPDANDEQLVAHTLRQLENVNATDRSAYFKSVVALASPDGQHWLFSGEINGSIARQPTGTAKPKLPYDRIFIPSGYDRNFAEMNEETKNSLSHRGRAFKQLYEFLIKHNF